VKDSYGVATLVRCAVWLDATVGLEVLGIGRAAPQGWADARRFVRALENSGLKSLRERPIRISESGPDSYVIG
jgi:hypothetical protein